MQAVLSRNVSFCEALLSAKAELNILTKDNKVPLIESVKKGQLGFVEFLFRHGANPNLKDAKERTALHHAVNSGGSSVYSSFDMERLCLENGADVNAKDIKGRTPIHYAFVKIGKPLDRSEVDPLECISFLCEAKDIDINHGDIWGKTPLHYAAQRNSVISAR